MVRSSPRRVGRLAWWRLRTHPVAFWAVVAAAAVVTALLVHRAGTGATAPRAHLGPVRSVPVAAASLDRGHVLAPGDLTWRDLPTALVPAGVADDPVGRPVIEPIVEGEPILGRRLAPDGLSPTAALLPPGHRGIAIPTDVPGPPLEVGDRVDLLSTLSAPGEPVATDALVVALDDHAATVAVHPADAPAVAAALGQGVVALTLVGR